MSPTPGPRATIVGAFLEGWRRVIRAPALTVGVLGVTWATALPLAAVVHHAIEDHLGSSAIADRAAAGWDPVWTLEFSQQAHGLGRTVTHHILGFGGAIASASRLLNAERIEPALAAAIIVYGAIWLLLSGGILDRLARGRPIRSAGFFAACGTFGVRFVRLGLVVGACYVALFRWLHPFLFGRLYDSWTRNMTEERDALLLRGGLYVIFLAALIAVNLVADFAKVRIVVEDRRSALGAIVAALRFLRRRLVRVSVLYALNVVAALVVLRIWMQVAPGAAAAPWIVLLASQAVLVARIWARLAFMASEVAFFQGELAHAGYTARAEPTWPDSAAVEAIRRLTTNG